MSLAQFLSSFIPAHNGYLPKWQLLVAVTALGNTVQAFLGLATTRRIYNLQPGLVTPLSSRTFGVWTILSSIVRFYAAYHINEKAVYDIAMWTYLIAFAHFASEVLIFRTATIKGPTVAPFIVATTSLVWMFLQYDFYVSTT